MEHESEILLFFYLIEYESHYPVPSKNYGGVLHKYETMNTNAERNQWLEFRMDTAAVLGFMSPGHFLS